MNHTQLTLTLDPDWAEILTAELGELGYEAFEETDAGLEAYIPEADFDPVALAALLARYADRTTIAYRTSSLEKRNWNAEWEANYQPIEVRNGSRSVRVRATFHAPDPAFDDELVIDPKMSFGTGHHETTHLMLAQQLVLNHSGLAVLDVGCGTGILGIMAARRGAASVLAFDVEEWAVENSRENAGLNNCPQVTVFQGTITDVNPAERFGLILANINRNVLLADLPTYAGLLTPGGTLLMSGFYEHDAPDIRARAVAAGLTVQEQHVRGGWTMVQSALTI
jgi:ribosomal protein L11 methyltransferase